MAKPLKIRVITKEEQEEKYKMIVYIFLAGALIFLLYLAHNYILILGFNHNSAIVLMISVPIILSIFIFRGKKIYWSVKSLSQDNYHKNKYKKQNRKGFFWLSIIALLILVVLFLQFYPSVSTNNTPLSLTTSESSIYDKIQIGMAGSEFYNMIQRETILFALPTTNTEITFNDNGLVVKVCLSDSLHIKISENAFQINPLAKVITVELYKNNILIKQKN